MFHNCKEEGERSGLDTEATQIKTESHGHSLRFCYKTNRPYMVSCNRPMTILKTLQTNKFFRAICKKEENKEMIIQRKQMPRAAVAPHFPCSLLDDNEDLDISFIRSGGNSGTVKTQQLAFLSPENLVHFYIKTRGEENIRMVLRDNELKKRNVDYVCVYAVKGEKVKGALRRDGRFNKVIFRKGALVDEETDSTLALSELVDHLDGKLFQIIISPQQSDSQESSQEMSQEGDTVKDETSEVPEPPQKTNGNHDSLSNQEKETEVRVNEKKPTKYPETKEIPNTQEILNLLRKQHGDLLKTLKERENLKNNGEVKKFFRVEYDKTAQSFSEVNRVKRLMVLSDSVCQIRVEGSAVGTGFLLFKRFVLTNAHVVGEFDPITQRLNYNLTAAFGFEVLTFLGKEIPVKNLVSFFRGRDNMGNHLDFALLELSSDVELPELLSCYSTPPIRGGVCIIGHPEGGVKRMDPCFIIPKADIPQAAERHYTNNQNDQVIHVITQQCLAEDWEKRQAQIMYNSCFFHGSSGSPVFDEHCNLIGVHTGGYAYEGEGRKIRSVMEYGLPLFPILVRIFIQCSQRGISDVVEYFESQNNLKHVLNVANKQLPRNHQAN